MLKTILLTLGLALSSFAQDCRFPISLQAVGTAPPNSIGFNNQASGCQYWTVVFFNTGFSALSIRFESASNGNSPTVPGTFGAFAGASIGSAINPSTNTAQDSNSFKGLYPFVQVNLTSVTGTGIIQGFVYGYKNQPANYGPIANGLCSVYPQAICSNSLPPFTWLNQGNATLAAIPGEETITVASPNSTGDTLASMYARTAGIPPAAPWTVIMRIYTLGPSANYQAGFYVADATRAAVVFGIADSGGLLKPVNSFWTDYTTNSATTVTTLASTIGVEGSGGIWVKLRNDGTNFTFTWSADGANYTKVAGLDFLQAAVGAHIGTATNFGYFFATSNGNNGGQVVLQSWVLTNS